MSSLSLMAAASPAFAQNYNSSSSSKPDAQQSQGANVTEPSTTAGAQNTPAESPSLNKYQSDRSAGARINEPAGANNAMNEPAGADYSAGNWCWIGLFGLLGLFGLKQRHTVRDETYRPART